MAAVSGTVSAAARSLAHEVSLGVTAALMAFVLGFTARARKNRAHYKSWARRNGPLLLVALSVPLILADTLRHVLQDTGYWLSCIPKAGGGCEWWSSAEYKSGEAETTSDENLSHLSPIGIVFTIFATYTGFTLLAVGSLWNANIMDKLKLVKVKWAQLRAATRRAAAAKALKSAAGDGDVAPDYVAVN